MSAELLKKAAEASRLGYFPVKVLKGPARGAWWSLFPCSAYWRTDGGNSWIAEMIERYGCRKGSHSWDLGTHYGIFSVAMARRTGPEGSVVAFEPDPVSFRRLTWHRRINHLKNLTCVRAAASDQSGPSRLYQYGEFGGTTSHLPFPDEDVSQVPHMPISLVKIDDWFQEQDGHAPDFIKIDVEGHGYRALLGMKQVLKQFQPVILMAFHGSEENRLALTFLNDLGFEAVGEDGPVNSLKPDEMADLLFMPLQH